MPAQKVTDDELISLWAQYKSGAKVAAVLGMSQRNIMTRRRKIEARNGITLKTEHPCAAQFERPSISYDKRVHLGLQNGTVLVFSDAHFWPGIETAAYRGLLWAIKTLKPKAIIANGDLFDGAGISRHPRINWQSTPSVIDELKACQEALKQIEKVAPRHCKLIWTMGNHDARFETKLSNSVPEFHGTKGFALRDHFTKWQFCWSVWPTDHIVVKHRYKGGIHATHNNTINSGKTIVTGHLHSLKVTPFSDYGGVRWGVDTGTLADTDGPQFDDYLEQNPTNWRSGFAVLTLHEGRLLWPELVHRISDHQVEFRGQVIEV